MKNTKLIQALWIAFWLIAATTKVLFGADAPAQTRRIVISLPQKQLTLPEGASPISEPRP
jgi:hypothetical protein